MVAKNILHNFEPYFFTSSKEDNQAFILNNLAYLDSLEFLLQCDFHQFWCTVLYEPSCAVSLRSFFLHPIPPYQVPYLEDEYAEIYNRIYNLYLLVYTRLITFKESEVNLY